MSEFDAVRLGSCCTCGTAEGVRNIVTLHRPAPMPGTGWGCVVCNLPNDGAVAVLCDACLDRPIRSVCVGYADQDQRLAINELAPGAFEHNERAHLALGEGMLFPEVA